MRALLVGYFSTFGDLEVLRQVQIELDKANVPSDFSSYDARVNAHLPEAVDMYTVDPAAYTHLFVVCGPFSRRFFQEFGIDLDRFAHCTRIGINLTMVEPLAAFNPLDAVIGRDSDQWALPDLSFLYEARRVPVAGLCLARNQGEYGERQLHDRANDILRRLASRAGLAVIELDTEFPASVNTSGLSAPEQFESICARLDVMLTTRLHGTVLALKNGVPVVALDAIAGSAKVSRQARAIGWPEAFTIDSATDDELDRALARCLAPSGREEAARAAARARSALQTFPNDLARALQAKPRGDVFFTPPPPATAFHAAVRRFAPAPALQLMRRGRGRLRAVQAQLRGSRT